MSNLSMLRVFRATIRMVEDQTGEKITMKEVKEHFDSLTSEEVAQEIKTLKDMGYYKFEI